MSEEEKELEDAEAEFLEEDKSSEKEQVANASFEAANPDAVQRDNNQRILIALGFTPHYHDKDSEGNDETNFGIRVMNMKIGVKFNAKNPTGKAWAYEFADNKKEFIKNGNLKQLPLVQRYLDIQAGKKPIPETMATGRIIERRPKSVLIEIEEDGEKKEIIFGWGAVKKHDDGHHFIPHGFSKPSSDNPEGKMCVPRDILLPGMDPEKREAEQKAELPKKPIDFGVRAEVEAKVKAEAQMIAKEEDRAEAKVKAEAQRIREKQGRALAATTIFTPAGEVAPKPIVDELVSKYLDILVRVTEAIEKEDRIPDHEKGFATKFLFDKVTAEMENGKGGSQEKA